MEQSHCAVLKNGKEINKYTGLEDLVENRPKNNVPEECGDRFLKDYIKLDQAGCLNIKSGHEIQNIFKNDDTYLESDVDEQLIISIPFKQHVKLKSIQIIPVDIKCAPKEVKLFVDQLSFGFEDIGTVEETQEYQFTKEDYEKGAVIPLKATKFRSVTSVTLFIKNNIDDEKTTAIKKLIFFGSPIATTSMEDFGGRIDVKDLENENAVKGEDEEYVGDLHEYLKNHPFMNWMNKLKILRDICSQLYDVHIYNMHLYNNIHSKNILFKNSGDCVVKFGETSNQLESIKYKAPEVLCDRICDIKSDIYALGLIMWELSSNKPVFEDCDKDPNIFKSLICNEDKPLRPIIISDTPQCYNDLMEQCWSADLKKRPNIQEVKDTIWEWSYTDKIVDQFVLADALRAIDCIQINKPVVKKYEMLNTHSTTATCETLSQFVSVEASIISEPSAAEIEIFKLLISRYDDINTVLESQPVHSIGPGFQGDVPCIFCWTTESLDPSILEQLKEKFQNKYEFVCVPMDAEDYKGSRSDSNSRLKTISQYNRCNLKRKQKKDEESDEESDEERPGNESDGENVGNGKDSTRGISRKHRKKETKGIHVISTVTVKAKNDVQQTFEINAILNAEASKKNANIKYDIYVSDCAVSKMLHRYEKFVKSYCGQGFYLRSAEVKVSPFPETGSSFASGCGSRQPMQGNKIIECTNINGHDVNLTAAVSPKVDFTIANSNSEKRSRDEWELEFTGASGKYDCWEYNFYKVNKGGTKIPMDKSHKNEWECVKMKGFCIEITQKLQFFSSWFSMRLSPEIKMFRRMKHSLKVTFKDLENFSTNFEELANLEDCYFKDLVLTTSGDTNDKYEEGMMTINYSANPNMQSLSD